MFPMSIGAAPDVLFLMKARTLSSKLWGSTLSTSTCVSIALRWFSGNTLIQASLTRALGSFGRLSSKFSDQLPDHIQQVKRLCNLGRSLQFLELIGISGCALHIPSVKPVGESVLSPSLFLSFTLSHFLSLLMHSDFLWINYGDGSSRPRRACRTVS